MKAHRTRRARDNPFRVQRTDALAFRLMRENWNEIEARFNALGCHAAVVGPHGTGKTTFLQSWAERLRTRGVPVLSLRLNESQRRLPPEMLDRLAAHIDPNTLVFLDGAEQMGRLARRRFLRRIEPARGLLESRHRPGRLPVLFRCVPSTDLLRDLTASLIGPDAAASIADLLDSLYTYHAGNLRACLRDLYDRWGGGELPAFAASASTPAPVSRDRHLIWEGSP